MAAPRRKAGTEPGLQGLSRTPSLHPGGGNGAVQPQSLVSVQGSYNYALTVWGLRGESPASFPSLRRPPPATMEFVFVTPREAVFPACYPQGFQRFATTAEAGRFLDRLRECGFFVERARGEETPAWKQAIPYCVVADEERVLLMKRRAKGGEARLHGKLSIGVGGHINPIDGSDDARGED